MMVSNLKIRREELQSAKAEPIELFYQGIRARETKEKYTRTLRRLLCDTLEDVLEGDFDDRAAQLVTKAKSDPDWIMSILLTISKKLRERTELDPSDENYLNPVSFDNTFKPIKKLLEMNDVPVVWKRIFATFPEHGNNSSSRGYTREEIQKMLTFAKGAIDKAIILVAASSGIRAGSFGLKWKDD